MISSNRCNWQNCERSVDCRESKHAPPYCIFTEERLEDHSTNGQTPRKQRRTWINSTDWVESISIDNKVSILCKDVINNPLHVPRVRTSSHVETICSHCVHRRNCVPLNTNNKSNQEGNSRQETCPVRIPELTCTTWPMFLTIGPTAVLLVVTNHCDCNTNEERNGQPNQWRPRFRERFVRPETCFVPCSEQIKHPE